MPDLFVPLNVNYSEDDRIIEVGPLGELLYIRGLAFVKRARSDGWISANQLRIVAPRITGATRLADRLVDVGLWESNGAGWYVTAWLKYNQAAAELSDAGTIGAHKRWHLKRGQPSPDCDICRAEGLV